MKRDISLQQEKMAIVKSIETFISEEIKNITKSFDDFPNSTHFLL